MVGEVEKSGQMSLDTTESGRNELRAIMRESRSLYWAVGLFSVFVNLLMLTGPIYMLQVYDRVLGSRSEETLLALTVLMAFLFGMMGLLDFVRGRVLARMGQSFRRASTIAYSPPCSTTTPGSTAAPVRPRTG
jgi:ABC-type protease/lipase transport system fused ATPase/permease subunit